MNKSKEFLLYLIVLLICFTSIYNTVSAHSEFTNVQYSDDIGWVLFEINGSYNKHSASNDISYEFVDSTFTVIDENGTQIDCSYLKTCFNDGAEGWRNVSFSGTSINVYGSSTGAIFRVSAAYDLEDAVAYVDIGLAQYTEIAPGHKHFTNCDVVLNEYHMGESTRTQNQNIGTCAHEIGHMIGLMDIYNRNDILMYGYSGRQYTNPQTPDINGAAVILGIHDNSDHVFSSSVIYYSNIPDPSLHKLTCTGCGGYRQENHNLSLYILSNTHGDRCDCGYAISCANPTAWTSWESIGIEYGCRYKELTCSSGHKLDMETDFIHKIESESNICSDCGFNGSNIWCLFHDWQIIMTAPYSLENHCVTNLKKCIKCNQETSEKLSTHIYDNECTDTSCNRCAYIRVAPGHETVDTWANRGTPAICKELERKCLNAGCNFMEIINTDTTHSSGIGPCGFVCQTCSYTNPNTSHAYTTPLLSEDGTDSTCNNYINFVDVTGVTRRASCGDNRLSLNLISPSPSSTYYQEQTLLIQGTASINCYLIQASVKPNGGAETWLTNQYNTQNYSNSYTFSQPGTYTIKLVARDLKLSA